ncbi:MAG: EAL domain-containing protein [Archangiaceae bacterium]|nr:EAL domain-containing protein [Archangiaceae bacterium]
MSSPLFTTCPGTILVVDDDDLFLRVCTAVLKRAGFTVEGLGDPRHVVDRLKNGRFDAVVSDVRMPNVDGVELLKAIRAFDVAMPVVLMSGHPTVETAMQALEHRALRMLQKPFEVDVLVDVVTQAVRSRSSNAPALLHQKLDRALATLHMAYQPIVGTNERRTVAWEALVRCREGAKDPMELLKLAEETSRLHELGRKIRDTVARDAVHLPDDALLFVNAHPADLDDPHLISPDAPLSRIARRCVLEITERASLEEIDALQSKLFSLRSLGFRLAVDDLGAGYAGLSTFAAVEPDFVKLDGSLVRGLPKSGKQQLVVASMLELARELGAQVIAEAIETEAEREVLSVLGIEWMQGYYFGRPAPPFQYANESLLKAA